MHEVSRREFLRGAMGAGALLGAHALRPLQPLAAGDAGAGAPPPDFPAGIELHRERYVNWSEEIEVSGVWTCVPKTEGDVVTIANWAAARGWRVRPRGNRHGFAPYTVVSGQPADAKILLVDITQHLTAMTVDTHTATFHAQTGVFMDDVMARLQAHGLGLTSIPAPGDVTLGGVLAINGHGAAIPARGENTRGFSFGSMSNRVLSLTAVVWNEGRGAFELRRFDRSEPITKALLTSLGRTFITSVTLRAEPASNLRCLSFTDIDGDELFAPPARAAGKRTFAALSDEYGRVEVIWFPFTTTPWTKCWHVAPNKPRSARAVGHAYNYPFSDHIPNSLANLAKRAVTGEPQAALRFCKTAAAASVAGLDACDARDLWGPAMHTQHYIRATSIRAADMAGMVLTSRANLQRVVHEYVTRWHALVAAFHRRGLFPANMPIEIRCSGVDDPAAIGVAGAEAPVLSSSTPRLDHPEWDTVIWINCLWLPGTPGAFEFARDLEQWAYANFTGDYATARTEWSKSYAFTNQSAHADPTVLNRLIPDSFRRGRSTDANWDWAVARLNELDPRRTFSNAFLDRLLV
ncbi:MAG TPA: cholesterol oxidase substrate-binding domain-containing protein [Acidimicrobiales bacterium]|nr:cholesterol oxidase substrate-binding domain-containing protein [Acidimicrobiales bacterium]